MRVRRDLTSSPAARAKRRGAKLCLVSTCKLRNGRDTSSGSGIVWQITSGTCVGCKPQCAQTGRSSAVSRVLVGTLRGRRAKARSRLSSSHVIVSDVTMHFRVVCLPHLESKVFFSGLVTSCSACCSRQCAVLVSQICRGWRRIALAYALVWDDFIWTAGSCAESALTTSDRST